MDLGAYAQIDNLGEIAKANNIDVPRLRGYRLMENEEPISKEEINQMLNDCAVEVCKDLCQAYPFWSSKPEYYVSSRYTDYVCRYFLVETIGENGYKKYTDIRWDRIHGWKRKILKFEIKKEKRRIQAQFDMWNKYAGKKNVLYIHSRIGGYNWDYYGGDELKKQPWFLEKVDDSFDSTYCDIYAVIKD